jgi:hypothetical protein
LEFLVPRLTQTMVRDAPAPDVGRVEIVDMESGATLRITHTGAKSWIVRRRVKGGRPVRLTLGSWPQISLAEARRLARKAVTELSSGVDPRARIKADAVAGMTVVEALEEYLSLRGAA